MFYIKKIILTGGGTAGHVTPNLALLPELRKKFEITYVGSKNGMEKNLAEEAGLKYLGISSGKLRRYAHLKNFTDCFQVIKGIAEAVSIIKKEKPNVIFSKGGFVAVPVVIAGKLCGVPTVIHESDMSPGLANKLSLPFATKVCLTFPETVKHIPEKKAVLTGTPIRDFLFHGDKEKGFAFCKLSSSKPIIMMMGGSQGSVKINTSLRAALEDLTRSFQVVHLCGKGNLDETINNKYYRQYEYLGKELADVLAIADLVISRAGANSISEFLAVHKPNLLIPLSKASSRGDQILNAQSFEAQGFSKVLNEEDLSPERLTKEVLDLYNNKGWYVNAMRTSKLSNGVSGVLNVIDECIKT